MTDSKPKINHRAAKLKRLRAVEELYLNGYCAKEIHDLLLDSYGVTYGTIRNDIANVRRMWTDDLSHRDGLEGKDRYLASLRQLRRKTMQGWRETDATGRIVIKGRNYREAHNLDKEIARLSGVRLASDEHNIHVTVKAAREFIERVMEVVLEHVKDAETAESIVQALEALANEQ